MKLKYLLTALAFAFYGLGYSEDQIIGKWDFVEVSKLPILIDEKPFVLEIKPESTYLEFTDATMSLYRNNSVVYSSSYRIISNKDGNYTIERILTVDNKNFITSELKIHIKGDMLQARSIDKNEYCYKKRK